MKSFTFKSVTTIGDPAKITAYLSDNNVLVITKRILTKEYKVCKQCGMYLLRKAGKKYYMEDRFSLKLESVLHIIHGLIINKPTNN